MTLDPRLPLFSRACVEKIGEPGDEATISTYKESNMADPEHDVDVTVQSPVEGSTSDESDSGGPGISEIGLTYQPYMYSEDYLLY